MIGTQFQFKGQNYIVKKPNTIDNGDLIYATGQMKSVPGWSCDAVGQHPGMWISDSKLRKIMEGE